MLGSLYGRSFLESVMAAGGRFKHVRTGNARPQQEAAPAGMGGLGDGPEALAAPGASASAGANLAVECPEVAHRQGAADFCAAYGLASAVHEYGDVCGAATIAACARAALRVRCRARMYLAAAAGALASLRARAQPPAAPHASLASLRAHRQMAKRRSRLRT